VSPFLNAKQALILALELDGGHIGNGIYVDDAVVRELTYEEALALLWAASGMEWRPNFAPYWLAEAS
jgi:hypothetical protein